MDEENFVNYPPKYVNGEFYIEPDTEVFILRGVPLDNTYEHTINWGEMSSQRKKQRDYFLSKAKFGIKAHTYQRVDREWIKVYIKADYLYNCNYIMFKNTAFNKDKWWYAFILDVEYINNNTAKIRYEIDVMQTWLPGEYMDYKMLPCFVERCHSRSDRLYENLIPENVVNNGEYVVDYSKEFDMSELNVVTIATEKYVGKNGSGDAQFEPAEGFWLFGAFGKVDIKTWRTSESNLSSHDFSALTEYLDAFVSAGKENSIVSIMAFPIKFNRDAYPRPYLEWWDATIDSGYNNSGNDISNDVWAVMHGVKIDAPKTRDSLGGKHSTFVPKNNKIYSYPFCYLKVNNECGNSKIYKWELFSGESRGRFYIVGTAGWQPAAVTYPVEYKNVRKNLEDAVLYTDFPVCPWGGDSYKAWWAQNTANFGATVAGGIGSAVAAIAGAGTGNPMLAATGIGGVLSSGVKIAESLYQAKHQPTPLHGDPKSPLVLPMIKAIKFVYTKESLRPEILKIYDDYFTKFGYAQKRVMLPPTNNRQRWTYVQTIGFEFNGEINDKDTKKIKSIFDNGITFWNNPDEIGNYDLNNYPLDM